MRAIITKARPDGTFDDVGMAYRMVAGPYKRMGTILRKAYQYANGQPFRVELFRQRLDEKPFDVVVVRPFGC